MQKKSENKKRLRLAPCPSYDVEMTQEWLTAMAEKGLFLTKDGFWGFIAEFECSSPAKVCYALTPLEKSASYFFGKDSAPAKEQLELYGKYGWNYLGKRGEFYIWENRIENPRPLDSEAFVAAAALDSVKKRKCSAVISLIIWVLFTLAFSLKGCLVMTAITMKTWRMALFLVLLCWILFDMLAALIYVCDLQKRILGKKNRKSDNRRKKRFNNSATFMKLILKVTLICYLFVSLFSILNEKPAHNGAESLSEYNKKLPFATLSELMGSEEGGCTYSLIDMGNSFNTVREGTDILAPRYIEYDEHANLTFADGKTFSGGIFIEYYEMIDEKLAEIAVREYYRIDCKKTDFQLKETPALNADFAASYTTNNFISIVLIQKGRLFIRISSYQSSGSVQIDNSEWMRTICESLGE